MKQIVNVGGTGSGKTNRTKQTLATLQGLPFFIYDVNNEYSEYRGLTGLLPSEFIAKTKHIEKSVIVYEEASMFIKHNNRDEDIERLMVRKRHMSNFLIFNFHSLRMVPLWVLDYTDYLILHETNDNPKNIETKFSDYEKIYTGFNALKSITSIVNKNAYKIPIGFSKKFSNGVEFKRVKDAKGIERNIFELFVKLR